MTAERSSRRLAAILAADIAGYTRLMAQDEAATHAALKSLLRSIVEPAIAAHSGRIVKTTGDGFLAEFTSVVEAALAAVEIQRAVHQSGEATPAQRRLIFRMGVNIGDVIVDDGDLFGDGVNVAARLESIATPGGICLSAAAYHQVKGKIDAAMVSRGRIALKNVPEPVEVFAIASLGGDEGRAVGRYRPSIKTVIVALGCIAVLAGGLAWLATGNRTTPDPTSTAATAPGATTRGKPVIAVLPFANLGGDASQDYFSDGLTEDLIGNLGRFNSIAVLARPAVERFRKGDMPLADIKRALDARYVVQGSVRRSGDQLRLSVQLADTSTATVIWSQQFEAGTKDLFAMQSEIVTRIAGKLAMQVSERETRLAAQKPTASLEAYDHVLRGRQMMNRLARAANIEARGHFLKAIELDPNYAAAHAGAAKTYLRAVLLGWTAAPDDTLTQAETIARKALSLDANNVEAYVVLAGAFIARGDYDQSLALTRKAIALNPSDAEAYLGFGTALLWIGKPDEAIAALETARTLGGAFDEGDRFHLGLAYFMKRRYGDALQTLIDPVSGAPHLFGSLAVLTAIYAETGEDAKARDAYAELKRNAPYFDVERFGDNLRDREEAKRLGEAIKRAAAL